MPHRTASIFTLLALFIFLIGGCIPQPSGNGGGGGDDDDNDASDDDATADDDDATADDDDATADDDDDATADDDTTPTEGDPVILAFNTDVTSITQGDTVVFTAVVTDPEGVSDVIGGTLESPSGATYGAFATFADEGTYEIEVNWSQMAAVDSIEFVAEEARQFIARFYDSAGHQVTDSLSIDLHCEGGPACDSVCVDAENDPDNCGSCGNQCAGCRNGSCYEYECVPTSVSISTCENACDSLGLLCGVGICQGHQDALIYGDDTCGLGEEYTGLDECDQEAEPAPGSGLYCCCGDS